MTTALVADIGGTNTRLAWLARPGAPLSALAKFVNARYSTLEDLIASYLGELGATPQSACLAVACPVVGDIVQLTNNPWAFSREALKRRFAWDQLHVINDFEAISRSLPYLPAEAVAPLAKDHGFAVPGSTKAVLGPGTGLGTGAAVPDGKGGWVPLPSEGGHVAFSPQDETEAYLRSALERKQVFVCNEDLVSGMGLELIYTLLAERGGQGVPSLSAELITVRGLAGEDWLARETLECFAAMLGSIAGDHALSTAARGGVYLAGGIIPRMLPFLEQSRFRQRFEAKGRYAAYLAAIPTYAIIGSEPGLIGASTLFLPKT